MRILICGGRDYDDRDHIWNILSLIDEHEHIDVVIHGGASGADSEGMIWAQMHGRTHLVFQAHWGFYGKAAGPMRNQRMLDEGKPDLVIAFPGGRGTADMVRRAKRAGVRVHEDPGRS